MDPDTERVRRHFDDVGDGEWDRLADSPRGRIAFEVHRRMLAEWVGPGDRVLEVGAGPGRFTLALAELGARVTVTDLSPVQVALNEEKVREHGGEHAVDERLVLDARDVGRLGSDRFDACVAYGGVLSYVFDDAPATFAALLDVVRPGGVVLASVMATVGGFRYFLAAFRSEIAALGLDGLDHELRTGDLRANPDSHTCRMYRWREVEELVAAAPCELVAASASNCASLADPDTVADLEGDPELRDWFVDWEVRLCREPGALDSGTHILFAVRTDASAS